MASEKSFPHLWLSEGFATYMTDIYLGSKYGVDSMNRRLMDERKTVINFIEHSNKPVVDSVSPIMDLLNANSYQKGAWILHMLHKQMGDTVFKKFIREYYDRFKGKNADTNDLEKIAEEISQKDLHSFFQQWLYTPGIPQLNVQWKYDPNSQKITVKVTQMQNQGTFEFPLDLSIETRTTKEIVATIKISRAIETFTIGVADPDVRLTLDPLTNLLFDGHIEKISP